MFQFNPIIPKTFVLDSQDEFISLILKEHDWRQVPKSSSTWAFKWTWKTTSKQFQTLREGQKINHFKDSDEITTKLGLSLLYKRNPYITQSGKSFMTFYPRSYNLSSEKEEFLRDYIHTGILNLLKKIIVCLQICYPQQFIQVKKLTRGQQKLQGRGSVAELVKKERILQKRGSQRSAIRMNGRYFIMLLFYIENCFSLDESYSFTKDELNELNQYGMQQIPFGPTKQDHYPSNEGLSLLLQFYNKCLHQTGFYQDGFSNIWVVKSNHSSRGRNINLIDKIKDLQNLDNGMKLIQKYVENIWVLHQLEENIATKYPSMNKIIGKKFDIRFWVLVKSFKPLIVYIFKEAYLKISTEPYQLNTLDQKNSHLTNFSVNWKGKTNQSNEQSFVLYSTFTKYLEEVENINISSFNQKIYDIVRQTLKLVDIKSDTRCFELYGFDVIIDAKFNPWILQCNMSPACSPRGELKQVLREMNQGLLSILQIIDKKQTGWLLLSDYSSQEKRRATEKGDKIGVSRSNILRSSIMNWNDLLLSVRRVDWKKYKHLESAQNIYQKIVYIQGRVKGRKLVRGQKKKSMIVKVGRSLKIIEMMAKIVKQNRKWWYMRLKSSLKRIQKSKCKG